MNAGTTETTPLQLSIVIPVHNAEETLSSLCAQLKQVCSGLSVSHEIILVDDASTDATASMLEAFSQQYSHVRVHALETNRGQAATLATGVSLASGDRIIIMDDDLQHPPKYIPALLEAQIRFGGNTLAIAVPTHRRREFWRSASGRISNIVSNLFLPKALPLRMTSFCCFSRQLAPELSMFADTGGPWLVHLVQRADNCVRVPLALQRSARKKSRYTLAKLVTLFLSRARYFSMSRTVAAVLGAGVLSTLCLSRFALQPGPVWGAASVTTIGIFALFVLLARAAWKERHLRSVRS